jgi:hypothetical protein
METMPAFEQNDALRVTFAPLVNKRGSLEQLWAHLFKAESGERLLQPVAPAPASNDQS